jgi:uncharacterized protein (TIGR02453 family)
MADENAFNGFPSEALDFLAKLESNNNRKWFKAHRAEYERFVLGPAQDFIASLGEKLAEEIDGIVYDTRTGGRGSLMRIYRDIRFSKDKTPYHTHVRMLFWHEGGYRTGGPGFFMGFGHREGGFYTGQWRFDKHTLEAYRRAIDGEPRGENLLEVISGVEDAGYTVGGETYKRVPRGYDPQHPRSKLLKHSGLYANLERVDSRILLKPDAVDVSFEHFRKMSPIVTWLLELMGKT